VIATGKQINNKSQFAAILTIFNRREELKLLIIAFCCEFVASRHVGAANVYALFTQNFGIK
jgi:hypothetical protein